MSSNRRTCANRSSGDEPSPRIASAVVPGPAGRVGRGPRASAGPAHLGSGREGPAARRRRRRGRAHGTPRRTARTEGRRSRAGGSPPTRTRTPEPPTSSGECRDQAGLADPGFAADDDDPRLPGGGTRVGPGEALEFRLAPDEGPDDEQRPRRGDDRRAAGPPSRPAIDQLETQAHAVMPADSNRVRRRPRARHRRVRVASTGAADDPGDLLRSGSPGRRGRRPACRARRARRGRRAGARRARA